MTTLSIKNVPEDLTQSLRLRAQKHHRSLQGELMAILEATLNQANLNQSNLNQFNMGQSAISVSSGLTAQAFLDNVRQTGLSTPAESAAMIREDRQSH